jgi:hypothetical protein
MVTQSWISRRGRESVTDSPAPPSTSDVAAGSRRLDGARTVHGASGWICLDDQGYAYNKAVAVVTLEARSPHPRLIGLAWPEKKPTGV